MTSLFSDLYTYRQRESRSPLEDYLTECLAAVLRVLPGAQLAEFFEELTGGKLGPDTEKIAKLQDAGRIEFKTQFTDTYNKRPDLVMTVDGRPTYVFENKVGHHVSEGQLAGYANWIKVEFETPQSDVEIDKPSTSLKSPRLFFVTHFTPVPDDFETSWKSEECPYKQVARHHSTWGKVVKILNDVKTGLHKRDIARSLTETFYDFLEEQDMVSEYPQRRSFAALELYLSESARLQSLLIDMWKSVEHAANHKHQTRSTDYNADTADYYTMKYVNACGLANGWTHLATGFWFPASGDGWITEGLTSDMRMNYPDYIFNDDVKIYLTFMNDDEDGVFDKIKERPEGWYRPNSDFFVYRDLGEFPIDADKRASEICSWLRGEADKLRSFLIKHKLTKFD